MTPRRRTGEGTWKRAENVFNERVRTAERELVSSLRVGLGITIPRLKKSAIFR
jgi:hypothetical protein